MLTTNYSHIAYYDYGLTKGETVLLSVARGYATRYNVLFSIIIN